MTRDQAIALRIRQLQGARVSKELLDQAIAVIKATNEPVTDSAYAKAMKQVEQRRPRTVRDGVDIDAVHQRSRSGESTA